MHSHGILTLTAIKKLDYIMYLAISVKIVNYIYYYTSYYIL